MHIHCSAHIHNIILLYHDILWFHGRAIDNVNSPHLDRNGAQTQGPADAYHPRSHL